MHPPSLRALVTVGHADTRRAGGRATCHWTGACDHTVRARRAPTPSAPAARAGRITSFTEPEHPDRAISGAARPVSYAPH